jgi:hypothetical protein
MMKISSVFAFEMKCLELMERQQLLEAVQARSDSLPADLRERVEEQETDQLRLLLLAARLIHALRHLRVNRRAEVPALQ